jgi:uncharacterized integral membrane protein (TIGR00698 family)
MASTTTSPARDSTPNAPVPWLHAVLPGLALAAGVAAIGAGLATMLARAMGRAAPDAIVIALVLGVGLRARWTPDERFARGIHLAGKEVLEWAIVLLGLTTNLMAFARAGAALLAGILASVALSLVAGFLVGRAVGLSRAHAMLVASGNAICGNSAIVAVSAVNGASREEIASSIAYTAVFGLAVVLALPLLVPIAGLSDVQFGVVAGLTVYAVPQVLAATYPVSVLAGQTGMLVKLARVVLLGPVVLLIALWERRRSGAVPRGSATMPKPGAYLPWFVTAFVVAAALQTGGLIPARATEWARAVSHWATVVSMAALGLAVEVAALRRVGGRVAAAVTASLAFLLGLSVWLARLTSP